MGLPRLDLFANQEKQIVMDVGGEEEIDFPTITYFMFFSEVCYGYWEIPCGDIGFGYAQLFDWAFGIGNGFHYLKPPAGKIDQFGSGVQMGMLV